MVWLLLDYCRDHNALDGYMARLIFDLVVIATLLGLANGSEAAVISYAYEITTPVFAGAEFAPIKTALAAVGI